MDMDTLDRTEWDVVISGTGLPQSLLALALSRSGKNILHLDRNDYYGGNEAALSLSEAEEWASKHGGSAEDATSTLRHASIVRPDVDETTEKRLGFSRAYSLALAPQLIYTRSNLLPALVSSRTHSQLDFQAVGSWFTVDAQVDGPDFQPKLAKVPTGREDVFQDNTLNLRAKRSLMKFLRFVGGYDDETESQRWNEVKDKMVAWSLQEQFGIADAPIAPLLALALTSEASVDTSMEQAVPRIARHLRSTGLFGPGFSAVLPKWGGLAEIAQVACRACAVGGGVYVLNKAITTANITGNGDMSVELSDGETITTKWLVGYPVELPSPDKPSPPDKTAASTITKSISVVSSSLSSLFPPTSEGGVTPAGAVVVVDLGGASYPPVHILIHSSESGECPAGQCVLYASVTVADGFASLDRAVHSLLYSLREERVPDVLWKMQFVQHTRDALAMPERGGSEEGGNIITLPPLSTDVVLDDSVLNNVKIAWAKITGEVEEVFMKFEAREGVVDDDE
ncbi:hypothetical protein LTR36_000360 [Oleoguttula mirabilis]|uniref:Rab proteins geranylgeranyltransferase n=1 Tax=Oleoguttula mirabilis TaxID=1507867 RepID=A0AAV9JYW4_9PEZI|nr:hypothetical protein LTR36_000360 [Oleoguttula mirabilis]